MKSRDTHFPTQPRPNAAQLPLPNADEIERFRGLYQEQIGVHLDSATAARTLADLAQFYFLTRGHERYQLLHPTLFAQAAKHNSTKPNSTKPNSTKPKNTTYKATHAEFPDK